MAFFPWTRLKQLFKQRWTYYVVVFAYNYLCNDISAAVQKQGYGVITFVPYMAVLSILAVDFVFSWIKDVRRSETFDETLPRHIQDIQTKETRQAGVMQMGQTHRSSLSPQRNFKRGPWMVDDEVEEAATGNKQQTGDTSCYSQCLCSDANDELAEVKKPQQSVSTTKNKCTEAQVWKSPEFPKQDPTSSLGKRSKSRKGGSTDSGAGVATTGNQKRAQTESTSESNEDKDELMESKNPQRHRSSSKNKRSTVSRGGSINSGVGVATTGNQKRAQTESTSESNEDKDELMESKNPQRHRSSSKNKRSTVSRGGSINSGVGVATTGNQKRAQTESTSQSNAAKDEVMELKDSQQHRSPSKNKQSTVSRGGSINSDAGVANTEYLNSAHSESTSQSNAAKDEVMELKDSQQHRSASKNKQSTVSRGTSINSGAEVASTEIRRFARTESLSQKDDAEGEIESKNLRKHTSLSKHKCVPQAPELPELHEPSLLFLSGTDTGSGMSGKGPATGIA